MEPKLWHCILSLVHLLAPHGIVMDAGANDGTTTAMLAKQFANHTIVSVEPILTNTYAIRRNTRKLSNVELHHAGLGSHTGQGKYPTYLDKMPGGIKVQTGAISNYNAQDKVQNRSSFPIYTVDDVIGERTLSLAHWDVEGNELNLLRGATATIRKSKPAVTLETFPQTNPANHKAVMKWMSNHQYTCVTIDEICGYPWDCRNHVCLPHGTPLPRC